MARHRPQLINQQAAIERACGAERIFRRRIAESRPARSGLMASIGYLPVSLGGNGKRRVIRATWHLGRGRGLASRNWQLSDFGLALNSS